MLGKKALLLAIGSGIAIVGVVIATRSPEPPVSVEGLPLAVSEPRCATGQQVGTGHITWASGSSFATPREALEAAWAGMNGLRMTSDFSGRYVRVGTGPNATLGREFTSEYPDGNLWVLALATWQSDGGWLISGHSQCFTPPLGEGDAGS